MNSKDIVKIKDVAQRFDVDIMATGCKDVCEIFPDGLIIHKRYLRSDRTSAFTERRFATAAAYHLLCHRINGCIETADRNTVFVDDCSAEITLFHPYDRIETLQRGYGNEDGWIEQYIIDYLNQK